MEFSETETKRKKETQFMTEWMDSVIKTELAEKAELTLMNAEISVEYLEKFKITPQSAPWHTEGFYISENIIRTLAGFRSIIEGKSLLEIEEFAARKEFELEILHLENTIRKYSQLLEVFILVHDIAKPAMLSFSAPEGSLGEKEGFSQHKYRLQKEATENEKQTYIKLFKAFSVDKTYLSRQEQVAKFYDKYEIRAHYNGHEREALIGKSLASIEVLTKVYGLCAEQIKLLYFVIANHMSAVQFGRNENQISEYKLLLARAGKAGIDTDLAIDLLHAAVFLDGSLGSLHYEEGIFSIDLTSVFAFMSVEGEVAKHRKDERRRIISAAQNKRLKQALTEAELDGDTVFALLKTPFGSERGKIMADIRRYVEDASIPINFETHQTELEKRVQKARRLFDDLTAGG